MQLPWHSSSNNIQLDDIVRSTNNNNLISRFDYLRTHLNDITRNMQTIQFEEKVIMLNQHFEKISNAVHTRILQEIQYVINILDQKQWNVNIIQDSSSMRDHCIYEHEGKRFSIRAEIADKELRDQQKSIKKEI